MSIDNQFVDRKLLVQGLDIVGSSGQDYTRQPGKLEIGGKKILGEQQAAISDSLTDAQRIAAILAVMRTHGIIATA